MNKKVWYKILILGALVNLFAASAWACGEASDITVKNFATFSTGTGSDKVCYQDSAKTIKINCDSGVVE